MRFLYLTRKDVLEINNKVIQKHGGNFGVLFNGNLDFCINSPQQNVYNQDIHIGLHQKAAAILSNIQKLHPFLDGNKRTSFEACDVFLRINGYVLNVGKDEAVAASLKITECSMDIKQTSLWVRTHARKKLVS